MKIPTFINCSFNLLNMVSFDKMKTSVTKAKLEVKKIKHFEVSKIKTLILLFLRQNLKPFFKQLWYKLKRRKRSLILLTRTTN